MFYSQQIKLVKVNLWNVSLSVYRELLLQEALDILDVRGVGGTLAPYLLGLVRCSFRCLDIPKHFCRSLPKIGSMVLSGVNHCRFSGS